MVFLITGLKVILENPDSGEWKRKSVKPLYSVSQVSGSTVVYDCIDNWWIESISSQKENKEYGRS